MTSLTEYGGARARAWMGEAVKTLNRPGVLAGLVVLAAMAAGLATYTIVSGAGPLDATPTSIIVLLVVDLAVVLTLAAFIAWRIVRLWAARRSGSAGARLHARMVAMFSAVAVVPAILVAVFAAFSLNLGIESWFSDRVKTALDKSVAVAESYLNEHKETIRGDVYDLALRLNQSMALLEANRANFQSNLAYQAMQRSLSGAIVFDEQGNPLVTVLEGFLIDVDPPAPEDFERARSGEVVILTDSDDNQVKALVRLEGLVARFLLVSRYVDAEILDNVTQSTDAVGEYRRLEQNRTAIQLAFGLIYVSVALVILLAAVLLGLWAANRLVSPIGALIGAAGRISEGDLAARVEVHRSDDEVATLGRVFNRMTAQLESQRNELIEANRQVDARRRFTEAVLSGVSAGVIGLDGQGHITMANRSALRLLGQPREGLLGRDLADAVPEMAELAAAAMTATNGRVQGQVDLSREGALKNFSVRVTSDMGESDRRGFVVTFDDITDLVAAQRTAAWADVARRIAHEIKNPLTPIQLSAERIRRKYAKEISSDPDVFEQCTQTIIRQVGDIGRMVDEFSSFARMPAPVMRDEDVGEIVRQAVFLQRVGNPNIAYEMDVPETFPMECDGRLISQALINVLKNAAEAVNTRFAGSGEGDESTPKGRIAIRLYEEGGSAAVSVTDNGVGLPKEERNRLTEPYVTTRAKGTGLGLAIVKKILEDHGGALLLEDAAAEMGEGGARVTLVLGNRRAAVPQLGTQTDEQERTAQGA